MRFLQWLNFKSACSSYDLIKDTMLNYYVKNVVKMYLNSYCFVSWILGLSVDVWLLSWFVLRVRGERSTDLFSVAVGDRTPDLCVANKLFKIHYRSCTTTAKTLIIGLMRAIYFLNSFIFSYIEHNNLARHTRHLFWMRNLQPGLCLLKGTLGSQCPRSFQKWIREELRNRPEGHRGQRCWHTAAPSGWWFFFEPGEELVHNFMNVFSGSQSKWLTV